MAKEAEVKKQSTGGYVKEVVTYMVMDDLAVKPMSTISSITLINSFGVKDLSQLEEKTLPFGKDEVIAKWRPKEARMPNLIDALVFYFYPTEKVSF